MNEINLEKIISSCFVQLKQKFYDEYTIEEYEDDTNPQILAKRDLIESLPPPSIKIIEIINESVESKYQKGFLIRYDYTPQEVDKIEFYGSVSSNDKQFVTYVCKKFGFQENQINEIKKQICKNFMDCSTWEPKEEWCLQFISGDIEKEPEIFYEGWEKWIFRIHGVPVLSEKFQRERFENFNKLYGLENDPIPSFSEVTKPSSQIKSFGLDLELLQKNISHIQLIPKVPKPVKTTFERVKKLYIYGYFEYSFFTITEHYAFLALESAIKLRYIQSLNGKAILSIPKKNLEREMDNPSHFGIVKFCKDVPGWNVRSLLVNGKKFPFAGGMLLDWLEENHLIRKWEKSIFKAGLDIRNSMSHLEKTEIVMPNANLLHVIANQINYIFHKEIKQK